MIELVNSLPAPIWNLAAALIALSGVLLTIFIQGRRLSEQFRHDRALKDRDREMALKKDVYLAAAEAISTGMVSIGKFVNEDIEDSHLLSDYHEKSPIITKAYVVAGPATWEALMIFVKQITTAHLSLQFERRIVLEFRDAFKFHEKQLRSLEKERDSIVEQMKSDNINLNIDPQRRQVLENNFKFIANRVNEELEQMSQIQKSGLPVRLRLAEVAMDKVVIVGRAQMKVLFAMRNELELSIEDERLMALNEQMIEEMQNLMKKQITSVKDKFELES